MRPSASPLSTLTLLVVAATCEVAPTGDDALTADVAPSVLGVEGGPGAAQEVPTYDEALALFQGGDHAGAIDAFLLIVEDDPEYPHAWYMLGYILHVEGEYELALDAHIKASGFASHASIGAYNAACANALLARPDEAFEWLDRAFEAGFDNLVILWKDQDLRTLREDPRFTRYPRPAPQDERVFPDGVRVIYTFVGEKAGDQFGWAGRNAGDVNADGFDDLMISAPYKKVAGANAGRIYLYSGADGRELFRRDGRPGEYLGIGIEGAGDVNGDGHDDVIAGAWNSGNGPGRAYVYSGANGALLHTLSAGEANDKFGWKVAGIGDLDGDGHADVAVGAPGSDANGENAGRMYVFSGKDGKQLLVLDGAHPGDAFGSAVAGHVEGREGILAIGAGNAGPGSRGRVLVFRLEAGTVEPQYSIDSDDTGVGLGRMFVSIVGDVNGDQVLDVYASDWENNARGKNTGRVYLYSGRDGKRLRTLTGERAGDGFGIGPAETGDRVDDFALLDQTGAYHRLHYHADAPAIVLFVQGNGCPIARNALPALRAVRDSFSARGVVFWMLNANLQDDRAAVAAEATAFDIDFPILIDDTQLVAEALGVTRTAEAIVVDPATWRVVYRGPVDDRMSYETQRPARAHYLRDALAAHLGGKPVATPRRDAPGCIVHLPGPAADRAISYSEDIAPLLEERCRACHRQGGVAPWSMSDYRTVLGWSPMMREMVRTRRMPPWHADPAGPRMANDLSLTAAEKRTLVHWIESGAPRGDGPDPLADRPTRPPARWSLGTPDVLLTAPRQELPQRGSCPTGTRPWTFPWSRTSGSAPSTSSPAIPR